MRCMTGVRRSSRQTPSTPTNRNRSTIQVYVLYLHAISPRPQVQWCYAAPTDVLASLTMPAVTNFRVSSDFWWVWAWARANNATATTNDDLCAVCMCYLRARTFMRGITNMHTCVASQLRQLLGCRRQLADRLGRWLSTLQRHPLDIHQRPLRRARVQLEPGWAGQGSGQRAAGSGQQVAGSG